jgi:hypothetical protein
MSLPKESETVRCTVTSKRYDNHEAVRNGKWAKCSEQTVVQRSVEHGYSVLLSAVFLNGCLMWNVRDRQLVVPRNETIWRCGSSGRAVNFCNVDVRNSSVSRNSNSTSKGKYLDGTLR